MTYETLLHDLNQAYMYFLTAFSRFLNVIKQHPLIMLSLFIVVSLPILTYIFIFISTASDTADDMTTEGFRIYKYFKSDKFKRSSKELRVKFHDMKKGVNNKKLDKAIMKWDKVPLKNNYINKSNYDLINSSRFVNSSSESRQGSSANIDVEYDDD